MSCRAYRLLGSFARHLSTISLNAREYLNVPSLSIEGGSSCTLKGYEREERGHMNKSYVLSNTVLAGSLERGGRPLVNSIAVIPKLQMSADESYCLPWMSSGAIQQGWKRR
jgi:hypothetical protein